MDRKYLAGLMKLGAAMKKADSFDLPLGMIIGSSIASGTPREESPSYADAQVAANVRNADQREALIKRMTAQARTNNGHMGRAGSMITGGIVGDMLGVGLGGLISSILASRNGHTVANTLTPLAMGHALGIGGGVLAGYGIDKRNRRLRKERYERELRDKITALRSSEEMDA